MKNKTAQLTILLFFTILTGGYCQINFDLNYGITRTFNNSELKQTSTGFTSTTVYGEQNANFNNYSVSVSLDIYAGFYLKTSYGTHKNGRYVDSLLTRSDDWSLYKNEELYIDYEYRSYQFYLGYDKLIGSKYAIEIESGTSINKVNRAEIKFFSVNDYNQDYVLKAGVYRNIYKDIWLGAKLTAYQSLKKYSESNVYDGYDPTSVGGEVSLRYQLQLGNG